MEKVHILGSPYELPIILEANGNDYIDGLEPLSNEELEQYLPEGWWGYYGKGRSSEHLRRIYEKIGRVMNFSLAPSEATGTSYNYIYLHAWSERTAEWLGIKDPDSVGDAKAHRYMFSQHVDDQLKQYIIEWLEIDGMVAFRLKGQIYITPPPFISTERGMIHSLQEPAVRWVDWYTRKVVAYCVAANNVMVDVRYYSGTVDAVKLWQGGISLEYASAAIRIILSRQDVDRCLRLIEVDRAQAKSGDSWEEIILYKTEQEVMQMLDSRMELLPLHLVRIVCPSTGRVYFVPVKPVFEDALEAIKSTQPAVIRNLRAGDDYYWDIAT
ncbi:MAG: hypothetical protein KatS3mg031_2981 [Chitinophagales bacterium]|nr:MAG: hypothetical protein KatS3mg031_2981 [Chitinophagales bacterium]